MSPPSRFGANRWITPVALLLLFASHVYLLRDVYLTHRFMITHDSVANFAPYQFAFTGLHTGVLPLWSPEMNAGEPLWPVVELHPAYDPVVLAVFAIATQVGATGITAFSIVLLFWLLGFALGGWLLARIIGLSPVSRVFVFIVLLWSSVSILMLYQSQYVVIARWVPLALAAGWWFLRQPSVSRAALFGVVLGLALPGYQTPYLVLFAVVLAAAGGHETLTLLRGTPRLALGVAALFALAILLPTLTAAAEWLGMMPVARLAWPRGTRAVLTFDVLLPLLGELRTESALYVGVVPSLLALVAATAALARPDRRARFWTWTTAGTMLIFLGAPEMITGRDQPFLFVRDWSFVLPLVVLCVAMLGGIGLDYVRARLSARWAVPVAIALTALAGLDLSSFDHAHSPRRGSAHTGVPGPRAGAGPAGGRILSVSTWGVRDRRVCAVPQARTRGVGDPECVPGPRALYTALSSPGCAGSAIHARLPLLPSPTIRRGVGRAAPIQLRLHRGGHLSDRSSGRAGNCGSRLHGRPLHPEADVRRAAP
jgi:hypothetical protein